MVWKLSWPGRFNRTASCLSKETVVLNSAHPQLRIFFIVSLQKPPHFPKQLSSPINKWVPGMPACVNDVFLENTPCFWARATWARITKRDSVSWERFCLGLLIGLGKGSGPVGGQPFCEHASLDCQECVPQPDLQAWEVKCVPCSDHAPHMQNNETPTVVNWAV